jgi:hypothetical protein
MVEIESDRPRSFFRRWARIRAFDQFLPSSPPFQGRKKVFYSDAGTLALLHFSDSSLFWPGGQIGSRRQNRREESFIRRTSQLPPREARVQPGLTTKLERNSPPCPMKSRAPHYAVESRTGHRAKGITWETLTFFPHFAESEGGKRLNAIDTVRANMVKVSRFSLREEELFLPGGNPVEGGKP